MIPRTDPGVKVEGIWTATGRRGTVSHTTRYDSLVDDANLVGRPGELFTAEAVLELSHHPLVQRSVGETAIAGRTVRLLLHEAARRRMTGDKEATR
jgi:alkylation response protein AidB-like acyl-CoA dehydrogenase